MPIKKIITDQKVKTEQLERAREMRRGMTPAETKLWQYLRAGRLGGYHFRRQQITDRFIVDFYCHQADLVVEVDGGIHMEQKSYDQERERYLRERGLEVIRFTNQEVNHSLEQVLIAILENCQKTRLEGENHAQDRD